MTRSRLVRVGVGVRVRVRVRIRVGVRVGVRVRVGFGVRAWVRLECLGLASTLQLKKAAQHLHSKYSRVSTAIVSHSEPY